MSAEQVIEAFKALKQRETRRIEKAGVGVPEEIIPPGYHSAGMGAEKSGGIDATITLDRFRGRKNGDDTSVFHEIGNGVVQPELGLPSDDVEAALVAALNNK